MDELLNQFGLKGSVLIAGCAGGLLRALSHKNYTFRENISSPICGALAAGYLTSPFIHYLDAMNFPLPPEDGTNVAIHAGAFLVGVCGMWVSDAIFAFIAKRLSLK